MPRTGRTDVDLLVQEVRALELYANDLEVAPPNLQEYWRASSDLINLSSDVETYDQSHPFGSDDDPAFLDLQRRLRDIAARLAVLDEE